MKKQNIKDINLIIIHCAASREDKDYTFDMLIADHKARGFDTCGYHLYIRKNGIIYKGRPLNVIGAHAAPFNTNSVGISYEGGVDKKLKPKDTRTPAQKEQILNCIFEVLREVRDAGGDVSKVKIIGHRDISPDKNHDGEISPDEWIKACPSFDAKEEYKDIIKLL